MPNAPNVTTTLTSRKATASVAGIQCRPSKIGRSPKSHKPHATHAGTRWTTTRMPAARRPLPPLIAARFILGMRTLPHFSGITHTASRVPSLHGPPLVPPCEVSTSQRTKSAWTPRLDPSQSPLERILGLLRENLQDQ